MILETKGLSLCLGLDCSEMVDADENDLADVKVISDISLRATQKSKMMMMNKTCRLIDGELNLVALSTLALNSLPIL
jgi:hypothetical protein